MGCEELIESLRKEAARKAAGIWREAEEEAAAIRAGVSARLKEMRQYGTTGYSDEKAGQILLDAGKKAQLIKLESDEALSGRLFALAISSLGILREEGYEKIFAGLALELPSYEWKRVKVNPHDTALAGKYFPGAEITADRTITGGMELEAEEGGVRVINTFEKRLERLWPQMLPGLVEEILKEVPG